MREKNLSKRSTPLRNSDSANKPFRSPFATLATPTNSHSPNNPVRQSPMKENATPKRTISHLRHPIKRRRIESAANDDSSDNSALSDSLTLKRIRSKRQEIEELKTKCNYIKKHDSEDLLARIDKWRTACKEALYKFHKDIRDKSSEVVSMRQVLSMLGIPEHIVKFTPEECDMT